MLPKWWGRGVSRLLLAVAVRMLAEVGLDDITLWVLEGNQQARRFYEACGFKPDGTRQLLDIGGLVPEVRYQLAAARPSSQMRSVRPAAPTARADRLGLAALLCPPGLVSLVGPARLISVVCLIRLADRAHRFRRGGLPEFPGHHLEGAGRRDG